MVEFDPGPPRLNRSRRRQQHGRSRQRGSAALPALAVALGVLVARAEEPGPGAALRAAHNRLLNRLWQMPFYLTTAKPAPINPARQTPPDLARSGYGPWRENIVATVFWVGES